MNARRSLAVMFGVLVIGGEVASYQLPELVRRVAVARIHALTQRPVSIDRVDLHLLSGRTSIRGFRLGDRDGRTPFADVARLDVRVRWFSLLSGHFRIRELALSDSTVRVVRRPDGTFNFSDLVHGQGTSGPAPDVTVERFALTNGKVTLEDQALPEPRTWVSDHIVIDARDLSTRGHGGTAVARSMTAGAPVTIELTNVRLQPIHLQATVTMEGLDLAVARVYLPPDALVVPERGRVSTSVTAVLDARGGLRADLAGRIEDVVLARPAGGKPLVLAPKITTRVRGFGFAEGALRLDQLAVEGAMSVRDPTAKAANRFRLASMQASVSDLTWPATTPGRLDLTSRIPGGGTLAVTGTVRPPPQATELRVRLAGVNLAPWAQFLPSTARVTGVAEADLRMNEPLAAGIPARVQGSIVVNRLGVADDRHEIVGARRLEFSGIELHPAAQGPTRVLVKRVLVSESRGTIERDRSGAFPAKDVIDTGSAPTASAPAVGVEIGEIVVSHGALAWRDHAVSPAARLDVSGIDARVTGIGWPLRGPAGVRAAAPRSLARGRARRRTDGDARGASDRDRR